MKLSYNTESEENLCDSISDEQVSFNHVKTSPWSRQTMKTSETDLSSFSSFDCNKTKSSKEAKSLEKLLKIKENSSMNSKYSSD